MVTTEITQHWNVVERRLSDGSPVYDVEESSGQGERLRIEATCWESALRLAEALQKDGSGVWCTFGPNC